LSVIYLGCKVLIHPESVKQKPCQFLWKESYTKSQVGYISAI